MADGNDHLEQYDSNYRRGVVLGLTIAEVMIILLFCLLLSAFLLLSKKDRQIAALGGRADRKIFVVSENVLKGLEAQYGSFESQAEINDAFQKLVKDNQAAAVLADKISEAGLAEPEAVKQDGLRDLSLPISSTLKNLKSAIESPNEPIRDIPTLDRKIQSLAINLRALGIARGAGESKDIQAQTAGILCSQLPTEAQKAECTRKVVELVGGKGLQYQSCWWDKTVVPWRTKGIFDVSLTDGGFILRALDPGSDENRKQQANLPLQSVVTNREIGEREFLAQTGALLAWSERNNCRFFVTVYDNTGANAKLVYQSRLDAVEKRFYKELTSRSF